MRQGAGGNGRHQRRRVAGAVHLDHVLAADRHIGAHAGRGARERQVVRDQAGVDHALHRLRRDVDSGDLAHVLVRHPHFLEVRRELQEGRERAGHGDVLDDLVRFDVDDIDHRVEARDDEGQPAVRVEHHHARPAGGLDATRFLEGGRVDDGNIVFASHHHPDLASVRREEAFVRRAADVGDALDLVRGGVDEGDGIGTVGDRDQRLVVRREAQAVHVDLALVQRREHVRAQVAQTDLAQQGVGGRVDHRDRVAVLVGGVDAVLGAWEGVGGGEGAGQYDGECGGTDGGAGKFSALHGLPYRYGWSCRRRGVAARPA